MTGSALSPTSDLLEGLADAIGQPVSIDERNECVIEFDGPVDVVIAQAQDPDVLSVRSAITPLGEPLPAELLEEVLALNFTNMPPGYAIALDGSSAQLMLLALVDAQHTSRDHFLSLVAGLLELVPALREHCALAATAIESPSQLTEDFA